MKLLGNKRVDRNGIIVIMLIEKCMKDVLNFYNCL